jgi:adenosylhomocysteinase
MKHQAIVGNIGHFDNEIDIAGWQAPRDDERINIKPQVDEWRLRRRSLGDRALRGPAAEPRQRHRAPELRDVQLFTNQTIAQIELFTKHDEYEKRVYVLPKHLDEKVARLHLDALGGADGADPEQAAYIGVPVEGPYKPDHYRY